MTSLKRALSSNASSGTFSRKTSVHLNSPNGFYAYSKYILFSIIAGVTVQTYSPWQNVSQDMFGGDMIWLVQRALGTQVGINGNPHGKIFLDEFRDNLQERFFLLLLALVFCCHKCPFTTNEVIWQGIQLSNKSCLCSLGQTVWFLVKALLWAKSQENG